MKLTKQKLKSLIKEELSKVIKESLNDFMKEFSYYRERGVGKKLSDKEIESKFEQAKIKNIPVNKLDTMGNSYTKLISGDTEEKRFQKFLDFYLKEKRSKETTRANNPKDKEQYLKNLVKAVKQDKIEDPIVIVEIEGIGSLIAGGRTRAAAAKTADKPAKVKIVKFSKSDLTSVDKVKKMINDLTI
tara:strand:+ start:1125 stop:1685 length:561 start_codon:yes stop_codon:yes gene_type:complete